MEIGIKAEEIMNENFPLLDASLSIEKCMEKLNRREEACVVIKKGTIECVLSYDELLKEILKRKEKNLKLSKIKLKKNFVIIDKETDASDIIELMRKGINYIIVKDENRIGLITKKEIAEVNQLLFDLAYKS